jgi:hypothetical protein
MGGTLIVREFNYTETQREFYHLHNAVKLICSEL